MLDINIKHITEHKLSLVDSTPFFDVDIRLMTTDIRDDGYAYLIINNEIEARIPSGLRGTIVKTGVMRLYYKLLEDKSVEIITAVKR